MNKHCETVQTEKKKCKNQLVTYHMALVDAKSKESFLNHYLYYCKGMYYVNYICLTYVLNIQFINRMFHRKYTMEIRFFPPLLHGAYY